MSIVTGVMLICETSGMDDPGAEPPIMQIHQWLADRQPTPWYWVMKNVAEAGGGSKHPQFEAWCGGFNLFSQFEEEFATFVLGRPWGSPEELVLVIRPEEGPPRVYRPPEESWQS